MSVDPDRITLARALLDHLGLTAADLTDTTSRAVPTVAEYLPRVVAAASPGTRRSYRPYWNRMATALGDRRLDTVTASDIEALMRQATAGARSRRNSRHGRHAGEHFIAAARAFYNRAIADGYITAADSPAHRVRKPRRLPNTRRALTPRELEEINRAARSGGNDIILDALLLRLHTETACRRGGALALRLIDLDADHALIRLAEKGGTQRWQPITPMLAARLLEHAHARGAVASPERGCSRRRGSGAAGGVNDAAFEVGDAPVLEAEGGPGRGKPFLQRAVVGGQLPDPLLERNVLGGDPRGGLVVPLGLQVADLAEEFTGRVDQLSPCGRT